MATFRLVRTRNHIYKKQIKYTTTKWKSNIKNTISPPTDSCKWSEISWAIWLLYCDQLYLHLLPKKCFWLLRWRYVLKQCTTRLHTNYLDTTKPSGYVAHILLDVSAVNQQVLKYCKTFYILLEINIPSI